MTKRGYLAAIILLAWGAGLTAFLQREATEKPMRRLADVGARIAPGAIWFAVERQGRQIGFASITVDTLPGELRITDYLVTDEGDSVGRRSAELSARLSRTLDLRRFDRLIVAGNDSERVAGVVVDDSSVSVRRLTRARRDSGTISHRGEALVAPLIPMVAMLREPPRRGRETSFDVFELDDLTRRLVTVRVDAESAFVTPDSAVFNEARGMWVPAHRDSTQGFHLTASAGISVDLWADQLGRVLLAHLPNGLVLRRTAFEIAFENWRNRSEGRGPRAEVLRARRAGR